MKPIDSRIVAAAILAVGLIVAAWIHREPRYELRQEGAGFARFDKRTGEVEKIPISDPYGLFR